MENKNKISTKLIILALSTLLIISASVTTFLLLNKNSDNSKQNNIVKNESNIATENQVELNKIKEGILKVSSSLRSVDSLGLLTYSDEAQGLILLKSTDLFELDSTAECLNQSECETVDLARKNNVKNIKDYLLASQDFKDFNDGCFCIKKEITTPYNMFFARTQIFLSSEIIFRLQDSVMVLEKTINSEAFKRKVFKEKYDEIKSSHVEGGVLMSYDFHIDGDVPKLIEINTNAGGAFLNYELCKVMQECCTKTQRQDISHFEEAIVAMFKEEFAKKSDKCLETVAIVDDAPERQFLYQEFLLCKEII
jgi:hypothetical protein